MTKTCFAILLGILLIPALQAEALKLPPLRGIDLRVGESIELKERKEQLIAFFLNRSCPCSQAHFDHLNDLSKKYPQFSFIAFHSNKSLSDESAEKYFKRFKINFPVIQDKTLSFANAFSALKTPHTFILNQKNEVLYQGGATNSRDPKRADKFYLANALEELSKGESITTPITKTLGCYIQR